MCVLTNERYKTYQAGFSFCRLGHALGGDFGALGCNKLFFSNMYMAYQIDGDDEQNRRQVKFSSYGQTGDHRARSKAQISLNFG